MQIRILPLLALAILSGCGGGGSRTALTPPVFAGAPASLSLRWAGANVGMAEISPIAFDYVQTDQGDLFDIAHKAGYNIFRVVDWMPGANYTANDWMLIRDRAAATGISLIPVLAQYTGDTTDALAEASFISQCEHKADVILGDAGLAASSALAFVDLVNEPILTGWAPDALTQVATYVHTRYPGVSVTVGGWGPSLENGNLLTPMVDVMAPHLYSWQNVYFNDMPPSQETQGVASELGIVAIYSGAKHMVVEEFGTPNGLLAFSDSNTKTPGSPASQAAHTDAMLAGIAQARSHGIAVDGAIVWNLYPGYGQGGWFEQPNADAVIVPQGAGLPFKVMPAVVELCKATGAACTGAQQLVATPPVQK